MKALIALLVMTSTAAFGEGAVIASTALPSEVRASLSAEISAARKADPGPFASVAAIRAGVAKMDANKRGRAVSVSLALKPIGSAALWPLLEQAAFEASRGDLNDSAWLAWQVGVLESIGMIRDDRALPVLEASLRKNTRPEVVRASAEAIGRLGTEPAARILVAMSTDATRGEQVVSAMGSCRRLLIAQALSARADKVSDERSAITVAKALGDVGNAWAWETPAVRQIAGGEEGAVRQVAAEALVRLFVRFEGQARQAASNALLLVDARTTADAIAAASADASPATKTALAELSERFAKNPVR